MDGFTFSLEVSGSPVMLKISPKFTSWRSVEMGNSRFDIFRQKISKEVSNVYILGAELSKTKKAFGLSFMAQGKEMKLQLKEEIFQGRAEDCEQCVNLIEKFKNENCVGRPKSLLIFVNPVSGYKSGMKIFTNDVAPIFKRAGIAYKVIITQRAGQIKDDLQTENLSEYDGVVIVGGDGSYTEACTGLYLRTAKDKQLDINNPREQFPAIQTKLGIIPAGTGQGMAQVATLGSKDLDTAILLIVLGHSQWMPSCTAYSDDRFMSTVNMLACVGLFGNVIRDSEKNRSLPGLFRYLYAGTKNFISHELVKLKLDFLPYCDSASSEQSTASASANPSTASGGQEWVSREGSFKAANIFLADLLKITDLKSVKREAHMSLYLIPENVSRMGHLGFLVSMNPNKKERQVNESIETHYITALRAQWLDAASTSDQAEAQQPWVLDLDGEAFYLKKPSYEIWFHQDTVRMFSLSPTIPDLPTPSTISSRLTAEQK